MTYRRLASALVLMVLLALAGAAALAGTSPGSGARGWAAASVP
jgi:hypothetical protein